MSTYHRFFMGNLAVLSLSLSLVSVLSPISRAAETTPGTVLLWNAESDTGQWKAIGTGVLDSHRLTATPGLRIAIDWDRATFGIGVVYQSETLPLLSSLDSKVTLEARVLPEEGDEAASSEPVVEWVAKSGDEKEKAVRLNATHSEPGDEGWVRYEFNTAAQSARIAPILEAINTLRVVFPKDQQSGKAHIELRLVELKSE